MNLYLSFGSSLHVCRSRTEYTSAIKCFTTNSVKVTTESWPRVVSCTHFVLLKNSAWTPAKQYDIPLFEMELYAMIIHTSDRERVHQLWWYLYIFQNCIFLEVLPRFSASVNSWMYERTCACNEWRKLDDCLMCDFNKFKLLSVTTKKLFSTISNTYMLIWNLNILYLDYRKSKFTKTNF